MQKFACRISVFTLAAVGAFAQSTSLPVVVTHTSGMIGVAEGQTARLNVLNPGVAAPALGVVCSAILSFLDSTGKVLKSTSVSVLPGTAAAPFNLASDADLALALDAREQIRATITIPAVLPPSTATTTTITTPPAACTLIGTLEIFDSLTRRTQAVLGGFHEVPSVVATPSPSN
jgi:hypothetical protein